jgi:hypothetical protein
MNMLCKCNTEDVIEIIGSCNATDIDVMEGRTWTEINIAEVLKLPPEKLDIKSKEKVYNNTKIVSKRIIHTPDSNSTENNEGLVITGKNLMLEGLLLEKIIYTADEASSSVHSTHFITPFSAWIVVDSSADNPEEYFIETCIEDVYVKLINERKFYKSVTLLLNAKKVNNCSCFY